MQDMKLQTPEMHIFPSKEKKKAEASAMAIDPISSLGFGFPCGESHAESAAALRPLT